MNRGVQWLVSHLTCKVVMLQEESKHDDFEMLPSREEVSPRILFLSSDLFARLDVSEFLGRATAQSPSQTTRKGRTFVDRQITMPLGMGIRTAWGCCTPRSPRTRPTSTFCPTCSPSCSVYTASLQVWFCSWMTSSNFRKRKRLCPGVALGIEDNVAKGGLILMAILLHKVRFPLQSL